MFPIQTCLACKRWEISDADLYCSWCGAPLTCVALAQDLIPFYPTAVGEVLEGNLVLTNPGSRTAHATIIAPAGCSVDLDTVTLEPHGEAVVVPFSLRAPSAGHWNGIITIDVENGEPLTARVLCAARPRLRLEGEDLAVNEGEKGPFTVTLRHWDGGPAFITDVQSRNGRLEIRSGGGALQPGGDLTIQVQLPGGTAVPPGDFRELLAITLLNAGTLEFPLPVTVTKPPRIELSADYLPFGDVMPGRSRRKQLHLINLGEAPLLVKNVSLMQNDGRWRLDLPGALPFQIRRAGEETITLTVQDTTGGMSSTTLLIVTNDPLRPELYVKADVHVLADPPVSDSYVGIDFGTTHSCIAVARPGEAARALTLNETASDPEQQVTMPSCVYWPQPPIPGNLRDCIVGSAALVMANSPATIQATATSIKRKLGQPYPERILGVALTPQEIAARVIRYMLDSAEEYLGEVVRKAVVTVPANFTPPQVRATVEACALAGLEAEVVRKHMMDEPVGAAVDYLTNLPDEQAEALGNNFHTLVYDFGGGTLDISIIRHEFDGFTRSLKVVASKGDNAFGGDDLTELVRKHLVRKAEQEYGGTLPADPPEKWASIASADLRSIHSTNYALLRTAAETIKRRLSDAESCEYGTEGDLVFMVGRERRSQYVTWRMTLSELEGLIRERLQDSRKLVDRALRAAGLREDEIPLVLLVGMASRTPLVGKLMERWFGLKPELHKEPKACVARGAHRKGVLLSLPEDGGVTELVRELDKSNCQYGIIVSTWKGRRFQPVIPDGAPFPAEGVYEGSVRPGMKVIVALNRGEESSAESNPEISPLGEILVEGTDGTDLLPLQVYMQVADHRNIAVRLHVGGQETRLAHFKEY
ncbi:MAG: molecular chaperone DnaK [Firmicutes bacterium]|nr:molecular chaperone DnaK [Bacillota bacterium]